MRMLLMWVGLICASNSYAQDFAAEREWRDHTGRFAVHAKLKKVTGVSIYLVKRDGRLIQIRRTLLSKMDQDFLSAMEQPSDVLA